MNSDRLYDETHITQFPLPDWEKAIILSENVSAWKTLPSSTRQWLEIISEIARDNRRIAYQQFADSVKFVLETTKK